MQIWLLVTRANTLYIGNWRGQIRSSWTNEPIIVLFDALDDVILLILVCKLKKQTKQQCHVYLPFHKVNVPFKIHWLVGYH